MAINGITTTQNLIGLLGVLNPDAAETGGSSAASAVGTFMADSTAGSSASDLTGGTHADFSQTASQLSALAQLQSQSPAEFKALAKKISSDISSAAKDSSDPLQTFMLKTIAGQFSNAAMSGSLTSLVPSSQSGNQLRGYGSSNAISLFSPAMAQGKLPPVFLEATPA